MKKILFKLLFIVLVLNFFPKTTIAQDLFFKFNAGYGLAMNAQNLGYFDFFNSTDGTNSYSEEQVKVSLSKGLNFGGAIGVMFNENIGAELGLSYLLGGVSNAKQTYIGGETDLSISSNMLRIKPSIIISANEENLTPYAKFGLIIGSGSILYEYNDNDGGDITLINIKLDGGLALGLTSAVGAKFNLSDQLSIFCELNAISLSHAPSKGLMTEASFNGIDMLPNLTTSEKEIEFVDTYTINWNSPPADSQPSKELKQMMPFSSFGINIGVKFSL